MANKMFPSPEKLMSKYPKPGEYCSQANDECAVRISIAMHENNIDISKSNSYRKTHKHGGIIHQPSAQALADWLSSAKRLGRPKIFEKEKQGERWKKIDFITRNGLIYFVHPHRGGDGPGHIDVIYNGKIGSGFYENRLIWFWEYVDGKYISN